MSYNTEKETFNKMKIIIYEHIKYILKYIYIYKKYIKIYTNMYQRIINEEINLNKFKYFYSKI